MGQSSWAFMKLPATSASAAEATTGPDEGTQHVDGTIEGWGFTGLELGWVAAKVVVAGASVFGLGGAQVEASESTWTTMSLAWNLMMASGWWRHS